METKIEFGRLINRMNNNYRTDNSAGLFSLNALQSDGVQRRLYIETTLSLESSFDLIEEQLKSNEFENKDIQNEYNKHKTITFDIITKCNPDSLEFVKDHSLHLLGAEVYQHHN